MDWEEDGEDIGGFFTDLEPISGGVVCLDKSDVGSDCCLVEEEVLGQSWEESLDVRELHCPCLDKCNVVSHVSAVMQDWLELKDTEKEFKDTLEDVVDSTVLEVTNSLEKLSLNLGEGLKVNSTCFELSQVVLSGQTIEESTEELVDETAWDGIVQIISARDLGVTLIHGAKSECDCVSDISASLELQSCCPVCLLCGNVFLDTLSVEHEVLCHGLDQKWNVFELSSPLLDGSHVV